MAQRKKRGTKKKTEADMWSTILEQSVGESEALELVKSLPEISADMTKNEAVALAVVRKAMRGDLSAAKFAREAAEKGEDKKSDRGDQRFELVLRVVRSDDGD